MLCRSLVLIAAIVAPVSFANDAGAQSRDQIRIVGSSTVFPFTITVAEAFGKSGGFKTPVVESTGTGGGLKLFCGGIGPSQPDIANASRRITGAEREVCQRNGVTSIAELKIGYDGIVIASSKAAKRVDLDVLTVYKALAKDVIIDGKLVPNPYKTWADVATGLPAVKIEVLGPPPTSGTRDAFAELVMLAGCRKAGADTLLPDPGALQSACVTLREDGAYIEAGENDNLIVQKLSANSNAFGVFGYSFLDQNRDRIQAARMDGRAPTYENIASGQYEVARPLFLYVKLAQLGIIPGIREFLGEYMSERALSEDGYLADKGLVVLPKADREAARAAAALLEPMKP